MKKMLLLLGFIGSLTSGLIFGAAIDPSLPYERFVGLGDCCLTRFQINHHLSTRFQMPPNSFGGAQVFDWMVIHDYNKLVEALENNLEDLLEREDLEVGPSWERSYLVKNIKYQMTWNHLFTLSLPDAMPSILEEEYPVKKQKIDYLVNKFRELKNYRTLYIVAYPFHGHGRLGTEEPDFEVILNLRNALAKIRGNDDFSLLYCPLDKRFEEYENIFVRTIYATPG